MSAISATEFGHHPGDRETAERHPRSFRDWLTVARNLWNAMIGRDIAPARETPVKLAEFRTKHRDAAAVPKHPAERHSCVRRRRRHERERRLSRRPGRWRAPIGLW